MVHGRPGMFLEAWKFSIYVTLPIGASMWYSYPEVQRYWADYWQYIKYPENPNTNVKGQIAELAKEKELQREQRMAYQEQLAKLQEAAERSNELPVESITSTEQRNSWWGGWFGGFNTQG